MNELQVDNITFDTLPKALAFLIQKTAENEKLLLQLLSNQRQEQPGNDEHSKQWMSIEELCDYHPDKPQRSTVYNWIYKNEIPVHKGSKKLRFLKSEIDAWLLTNRRKTNDELITEAPGKVRAGRK